MYPVRLPANMKRGLLRTRNVLMSLDFVKYSLVTVYGIRDCFHICIAYNKSKMDSFYLMAVGAVVVILSQMSMIQDVQAKGKTKERYLKILCNPI